MVISIVGLEISIPELIWTVISFFVLMFLLKKFLYQPILRFMDEREARVQAVLEEGRQARRDLEASTALLKQELVETGAEARRLVSEARSQSEQEKGRILAEAHQNAEQMLKGIRSQVQAEEQQCRQQVDDQMPDLVASLASALLGGEDVSGKNGKWITDYVNGAEK